MRYDDVQISGMEIFLFYLLISSSANRLISQMLPKLNFPPYPLKIVATDGQSSKIFDIIRRKYVALTPEEWVRQHIIHYLVNEKNVPRSLLAVEKILKVN